MIVSEIFEIKATKNIDKSIILDFFMSKNLKVVKWAVVGFSSNIIRVLTSFEK